VNTSRLWAGSGFGLGLGAFFGSFLPLSLLPMGVSLPQKGGQGEDNKLIPVWHISIHERRREGYEMVWLQEKPLVQARRLGSESAYPGFR
jgi:hypothetical protein